MSSSERVRRVLNQALESWKKSGVRWVGRPSLLSAEPVPVSDSEPMESSPVPSKSSSTPRPGTKQENPSCAVATGDRQSRLAALAERVKACRKCEHLAKTRTQTVFGVGDPFAKVMFIGEAPGADEDATGEPFVGKAGQLLNKIIEASKLRREDLYICNILRCRPPENRTPLPQEAENCREFLDGQIAIVDPDYIVCWGACAAQNLLGVTDTIGKLRKRFLQYGRAKVLCTYHPSYLLRNPSAKKDVWEDMQLLMAELGIPLDPPANKPSA